MLLFYAIIQQTNKIYSPGGCRTRTGVLGIEADPFDPWFRNKRKKFIKIDNDDDDQQYHTIHRSIHIYGSITISIASRLLMLKLLLLFFQNFSGDRITTNHCMNKIKWIKMRISTQNDKSSKLEKENYFKFKMKWMWLVFLFL